jgi:hypothetical protein
MNESRKSKRRRKATRRARGWSRARRLSIEAMEGRVLLSGTAADLSTFAADMAPVAVAPVAVPITDWREVLTNSDATLYTIGGSLPKNDGGFLDTTITNQVPALSYGNAADQIHPTDDRTGSVLDSGLTLHADGGQKPYVLFDSATANVTTFNSEPRMSSFDVSGGFVGQTIDVREVAGAQVFGTVKNLAEVAEGGSISLASIRLEFSRPAAENVARSVAVVSTGTPDVAEASKFVEETQIDGEWTRAIAMESVSASEAFEAAGARPSGEAGHEPANKSRGETGSQGGDSHAKEVTATERIEQPIGAAAVSATDSGRATPVAFTPTASVGGVAKVLAPAHRVETVRHDAERLSVNSPTRDEETRDELFSQWHPSVSLEANSDAPAAGERRFWVNPGPFLAVLALERFISLEPREKDKQRNGSLR